METLLEIAKRLSIKPNPNMSDEEYGRITERITSELEEKYYRYSEFMFTPDELNETVYTVHKDMPRKWGDRFLSNLDYVKNADSREYSVHDQHGRTGDEMGGSFIYHDARVGREPVIERFTLDLKQDSPNFPTVIDGLDKFIVKHHTAFKIVTKKASNRSDTMNLYMCKKIFSKIAAEVYKIVKPVLNEDNHDYLDGVDIVYKGEVVKGMKYGPDPSFAPESWTMARECTENILHEKFGEKFDYLRTDVGLSLGQFSARLEELDLVYYLYDKGKNPFDLAHRYGPAPNDAMAKAWGYIRDSYDAMDITNNVNNTYEYIKTELCNSGFDKGKEKPAGKGYQPMTPEDVQKAKARMEQLKIK